MTPQPVGGFKPATIRGLHVAISTLSIPSCVPIAICGLLAGTLCVAAAWWNALPATLPGDELFNAERAIGLTFRALIDWSQPADAPPMPRLALWGIGIDLSALAVLFAGAALRLFRPSIDAQLARHASDVRMVVLGDEAATVVAAEPTQYTNIFLSSGMPGSSTLRGLRARLDPDFLAASLPRIAPRVRELLALGIDSSANIELVRRTLNLRRESLPAPELERLWIRVDPRELRTSLGREEFPRFADTAQETRLISLPEARCRRLLQDQPPNKVRVAHAECRAAIVIIGLGETGLELLGRLCAQAQSPTFDPLVIVLIDTEAPAITRELLELWPGLPLVVELIPLALEPHLPLSAIALLRHLHTENLIPTCLYIAMEDPALCSAWEREIGLAVRLAARESPLVLSVAQLEDTDRSLLAEEEEGELVQRALHEDYMRRLSGAAAKAGKPSAVEWCRLPFDYREDNRSLADHFSVKALDLDLLIAPAHRSEVVSIDATMIEALAAAEHRRWIASRTIAGWRFGETQSESERTHPSMVAWENLTEAEREKDRDFIRHMPTVARAAGLSLEPLHSMSLPRGGLDDSKAEALIAEAQRQASGKRVPHLIVPIEDARGFKLAQRLMELSPIVVSLVMAQPLIGLAIAAGQTPQGALQLARSARTIWIVPPEAFEEVLARWPSLTRAGPV
jgi:RyR domain